APVVHALLPHHWGFVVSWRRRLITARRPARAPLASAIKAMFCAGLLVMVLTVGAISLLYSLSALHFFFKNLNVFFHLRIYFFGFCQICFCRCQLNACTRFQRQAFCFHHLFILYRRTRRR